MLIVIDTDVIVAAVRSPTGASAALLRALQAGQVQAAASVPLLVEVEATCTRAEHVSAAQLQPSDVIDSENMARAEGISMNQFIATAVAEKLSALSTADFFVQRSQRAQLPD